MNNDALRLAEILDCGEANERGQRHAATELRRLYEVNTELVEALKNALEWMESLRACGDAGFWDWSEADEYTKGRVALAKAGEST